MSKSAIPTFCSCVPECSVVFRFYQQVAVYTTQTSTVRHSVDNFLYSSINVYKVNNSNKTARLSVCKKEGV